MENYAEVCKGNLIQNLQNVSEVISNDTDVYNSRMSYSKNSQTVRYFLAFG